MKYLANKRNSRATEPSDMRFFRNILQQQITAITEQPQAEITNRQRELLAAYKNALNRIAHGNYAICLHCQEAIDFARLRVMPATNLCLTCSTVVSRGQSRVRTA